MSEPKRKALVLSLLVMIAGMVFSLHAVDPMRQKIRKAEQSVSKGNRGELMVQLPGQFLIATMTGFKEVIAGALWVRADEFFHHGDFEAIMPIVRMVTWLDPHNIDVYTTGAWHLDYNFTDKNEWSDKRYIPASISLIKEGIRNNPGTWDLWFELGWTHYDKKLLDHRRALDAMIEACKCDGYDVNTGQRTPRPEFVDRMLAHQYEKCGMFKEAEKAWFSARKRVAKGIKAKKNPTFVDYSSLDVCDRNLALLYLRQAWRYGDMDAYKKGVALYKKLARGAGAPPDVKMAAAASAADYAKRIAAHNPPHDTAKPVDAGLEFTWKKVAPKVFLLRGKVNIIRASEYKDLASECVTHWYEANQALPADKRVEWRDGARIGWMLADADYKYVPMDEFSWKIDLDKTVVWDTVFIGGGTFSCTIDLSDNPRFYPFKAKKYKLTVFFEPIEGSCPDFVQDRIGWKGEALTDKKYLDTKSMPGYRTLRAEMILDRKDVL